MIHSTVPAVDVVEPGVAVDRAVRVRAQGDDAGGVLPRHRPLRRPVDDRVCPLAVDVDVVGGGVQVPGADPRRPAADLGEPQALGPVEPLHVGRRRADAERVDHACAHLSHLGVERRAVDLVRGHELGRDPPLPHRLEDVGVVVRDPVVRDAAVDGDRVVEALVALDELLDGDRVGALRSRPAPGAARPSSPPGWCPARPPRPAA